MTVQLIRRTAKELAGADYEDGPHSDRFRKFWPDVKQFIGRNWPTYVPMARTILTNMLTRPDVSEDQKHEIYEALLEDRQRSEQQASTKVGMGKLKLRPDHPGTLEKKLFYN